MDQADSSALRRVHGESRHALPQAGRVPKASWFKRPSVVSIVIVVLLVITLLGPSISYKPAPFTGEGSPIRQTVYALLAIAMALKVRPWARPDRLLAIPLILTIALAWCWISVSWAVDPAISVRRVALTTVAMWTVFMMVQQSSHDEVMRLMRIVLVVFLIANYVTALAFPSIGIHQFDTREDVGLVGAWRGIMLHKNYVGSVSAITAIVFIFDAKRMQPALRALIVVAATFCLYKSMSKTSIGFLLFAILCGVIYIRYNPAYRLLLVPFVCLLGVATYFLTIDYWDDIIAPFTDPQGFTGRVHIWTIALRSVHEHPWFGVGYGGFWNSGDNSPIYHYTHDWVSLIGSAHSGYIDLMVQLGIPGTIYVVFAALIWPLMKLLASQQISRSSGALLLAILVFCAGHNFTETTLFYRDEIVQVFLTITLALIWQGTERKPVAPPAVSPGDARTRQRVFSPARNTGRRRG